MDRYRAHEIITQLVESYHDRHKARTRLTQFEGANEPPREPGEFPNLEAFLDFHDERCEYEDTLEGLRTELARSELAYEEAEKELASILPANRPLRYDYDGKRQEFAGTQFMIMFKRLQGGGHQTIISSSGPSTPSTL